VLEFRRVVESTTFETILEKDPRAWENPSSKTRVHLEFHACALSLTLHSLATSAHTARTSSQSAIGFIACLLSLFHLLLRLPASFFFFGFSSRLDCRHSQLPSLIHGFFLQIELFSILVLD